MRPDQLENRLRKRLDALGPAPRAELIHVLMLPDFEQEDAGVQRWCVNVTGTPGDPMKTVRQAGRR